MSEHVNYGRCTGCGRWVPRDEMLSVHTELYDATNRRELVRQRYCPPCFESERDRVRANRWDHLVVTQDLLTPMPDGSFPPDSVIRQRWEYVRSLGTDVPSVPREDGPEDRPADG